MSSRRSTGPARALGVASVGLGVLPLAAPDRFLALLGLRDHPTRRAIARAVGARELVAAAGLLATPGPAWLWARVGGDAIDLALLGRALVGGTRPRTVAATALTAGITVVDVLAATRTREDPTVEMKASTTVAGDPEQIYDRWADLESLPTFMNHLDEVRSTGPGRTHWVASAPFGSTVEWDAETVEDVRGQRLAWRSVGDTKVPNEGRVEFRPAPGDRGTEVRVTLRYDVPGGALGRAAARWFGEEPHQQLDDDLRRFKQVVETGEVVRSDGAPRGKKARSEFPQRPAQPLSRDELEELKA